MECRDCGVIVCNVCGGCACDELCDCNGDVSNNE